MIYKGKNKCNNKSHEGVDNHKWYSGVVKLNFLAIWLVSFGMQLLAQWVTNQSAYTHVQHPFDADV